jgi:Na+/H+-translocating membrane pyrophosphatase
VETLPLALFATGISINVVAALRIGSPTIALAFLASEAVQILASVPLTLVLLLAVAWLTNIYFGTFRQAVVRLAAFSIASQALGVLMLFALPFTSSPLLSMVVVLLGVGGMFWLFATLFELELVELVITFVCALSIQGMMFGLFHLVIRWVVPML